MIPSTPLTETQEEALVALCLFAAFADGEKSDVERGEVRRLAEAFQDNLTLAVSQKILSGKLSLAEAVQALTEPAHRLLAYEMALGVCEADGAISPAERTFLDDLRDRFTLTPPRAAELEKPVDAIAQAPLGDQPASTDNSGMILRYAILNGALELLPDSLATMAIIPLQMKMVYRVGKSHGVSLDAGHIKEFAAAAGLGMASQVAEGFARKFAKGLMRKLAGKTGGKIADQAAGSAFSFASTYALGLMADRYYSSGRSLTPDQMRTGFQSLLGQARTLHGQVLPQIQDRAKSLDAGSLVGLLRDPSAV